MVLFTKWALSSKELIKREGEIIPLSSPKPHLLDIAHAFLAPLHWRKRGRIGLGSNCSLHSRALTYNII